MTTANGSVVRRSPAELHRKSLKIGRLQQGKSRAKGSRVGDDLVEAFEEMAKHLRGEIELEAHNLPDSAITPAQIRAIRFKVASSTKEFECPFGIPARTMESYEQGDATSMERCEHSCASLTASRRLLLARSYVRLDRSHVGLDLPSPAKQPRRKSSPCGQTVRRKPF